MLGSQDRGTNGVITSSNPKQPFRAVDYSDYVNTPHIVEVYQNGTSWYRVWSDGWCEQGGIVQGGRTTVTFLKPFLNNGYFMSWQYQDVTDTNNVDFDKISVNSKTNTSAIIYAWINKTWTIMWEAKGYIA